MWDKIERFRIHILGLALFLSMNDSLAYLLIGGFKAKGYQLLVLIFLLPVRFVHKKSLIFFGIFNAFLLLSCYRGSMLGVPTSDIVANIVKLEMFALFVLNITSLTNLFERRRELFAWIFCGALLSAVYGLLQFFCYNLFHYVLPGNPESAILGDHLLKRVYSFFPEPNWFSLQMLMALPLIYFVARGDRLRMIGFFVILAAIILSMTRGVWICLLFFFYLFYAEQKGAIKVLTTIAAVFLAVVFFITIGLFFSDAEFFFRLTNFSFEDDPSFASRLNGLLAMNNYFNYVSAGNIWSVIIGCGMLSFKTLFWVFEGYDVPFFFAPNTYLDLTIEHGAIVTVLFIYLLVRNARKIWKFKGFPFLSMKLFAFVFISFLFMAFFYTIKSYISNMLLFAFYIALLFHFPFNKKEITEDFG